MVVPLGSANDSTLGRPGTESLRSSAATPCSASAFFRSPKSDCAATSNDSLAQRASLPAFSSMASWPVRVARNARLASRPTSESPITWV